MTSAEVAPPTTVAAKARRNSPGNGRGQVARRSRSLWAFMVPALLVYLFVVIWPSLQGVYFAFTDWDGLNPQKQFVGFSNFQRLFSDPKALGAIKHTLIIAVVITFVQNGVGLLLALGVNSKIKSRNILRVLLFAPAIITPVATAYLWQNILSPSGALNSTLRNMGLPAIAQNWLGDGNLALWMICLVIVWQFAGYSMVIFLANLQGISEEVLEASYVDGAGPFRRFFSIVLPELAPSITINLMLSIIGGLKLFDQVWVMTAGGPGGATETMSTLIYKNAFQFGEFSYGIAMALVLTVLVAVLSGFQYFALSKQNKD